MAQESQTQDRRLQDPRYQDAEAQRPETQQSTPQPTTPPQAAPQRDVPQANIPQETEPQDAAPEKPLTEREKRALAAKAREAAELRIEQDMVTMTSLVEALAKNLGQIHYLRTCLLYTSPSPRDGLLSRMPSSA